MIVIERNNATKQFSAAKLHFSFDTIKKSFKKTAIEVEYKRLYSELAGMARFPSFVPGLFPTLLFVCESFHLCDVRDVDQ